MNTAPRRTGASGRGADETRWEPFVERTDEGRWLDSLNRRTTLLTRSQEDRLRGRTSTVLTSRRALVKGPELEIGTPHPGFQVCNGRTLARPGGQGLTTGGVGRGGPPTRSSRGPRAGETSFRARETGGQRPRGPGVGSRKARRVNTDASRASSSRRVSVMILPQVHLRKPCYDFYFL